MCSTGGIKRKHVRIITRGIDIRRKSRKVTRTFFVGLVFSTGPAQDLHIFPTGSARANRRVENSVVSPTRASLRVPIRVRRLLC